MENVLTFIFVAICYLCVSCYFWKKGWWKFVVGFSLFMFWPWFEGIYEAIGGFDTLLTIGIAYFIWRVIATVLGWCGVHELVLWKGKSLDLYNSAERSYSYSDDNNCRDSYENNNCDYNDNNSYDLPETQTRVNSGASADAVRKEKEYYTSGNFRQFIELPLMNIYNNLGRDQSNQPAIPIAAYNEFSKTEFLSESARMASKSITDMTKQILYFTQGQMARVNGWQVNTNGKDGFFQEVRKLPKFSYASTGDSNIDNILKNLEWERQKLERKINDINK